MRHPAVRGPLYEVLGRYPQSIVTEHAVYLRLERPAKELEPLLNLALELSRALEKAGRADEEERGASQVRQLNRVTVR